MPPKPICLDPIVAVDVHTFQDQKCSSLPPLVRNNTHTYTHSDSIFTGSQPTITMRTFAASIKKVWVYKQNKS